jgi:hypothetical protein
LFDNLAAFGTTKAFLQRIREREGRGEERERAILTVVGRICVSERERERDWERCVGGEKRGREL